MYSHVTRPRGRLLVPSCLEAQEDSIFPGNLVETVISVSSEQKLNSVFRQLLGNSSRKLTNKQLITTRPGF